MCRVTVREDLACCPSGPVIIIFLARQLALPQELQLAPSEVESY